MTDDWASQKEGRNPSIIRGRIGGRMVARMDGAGVDKSVLLAIDWGPDFTGTLPITTVVDHMLDLAAAHQGSYFIRATRCRYSTPSFPTRSP